MLASALALLLAAPAPAPGATVSEARPRELAADVRFLDGAARSDPEGWGRGRDVGALYVSARMEAAGLRPAGDGGGWLQPVPLRAWTVDPQGSFLAIHGPGQSPVRLVPEEDFAVLSDGDLSEAEVDGPIAFAGYAVSAPEYGYDDLRGVDFKGKVAVVLQGSPASDRPNFFPPSSRAVHADPREKMRRLAARGAVGVLLVQTPAAEETVPWGEVMRRSRREELGLAEPGKPPTGVEGLPGRAILSMRGLEKVLAAAGVPGGARAVLEKAEANRLSPQEWPVRARLRLRTDVREVGSASALGMVPGTDPRLAREVVLVTAPVGGTGSSAAGAAVLLQVAASLASLPGGPRRSVLLAALAGVDDDRLGAEYLARHLPVERDRIVAHLSVEAWPALRPFDGVVARAADLSTLGGAVQSAATSVGAAVIADTGEGAGERGGATAFARMGVPTTWLLPVAREGGAAAGTWDWDSLSRLARLETALVRTVAQADARPRWTAPDPWAPSAGPAGR